MENIFLQQGILGAIVLVLSGVVVYLFKDCKILREEINKQYEKRLEYKKELANVIQREEISKIELLKKLSAEREALLKESIEHEIELKKQFAGMINKLLEDRAENDQ